MSIVIPTEHVIIVGDGTQAISRELVLGKGEEQKSWLENATRFWAKGCKNRLLSWGQLGSPITTTSTSFAVRLEVAAQLSSGRSATATSNELEYYIDHEEGEVEIDVQDSGGTSISTATESATTRVQATGQLGAGSHSDLIIRVRSKANSGQTGGLYGIWVWERDVVVGDLPAAVKWDSDRVAAEESHNAATHKRLIESLWESIQHRMPRHTTAFDVSDPLVLGSVGRERYFEILVPVVAEARTLGIRLRYEVKHGPVTLRFRLGLGGRDVSTPTALTTLTTTSGRTTTTQVEVDLGPVHRSGQRVARLHLLVESKPGSTSGSASVFSANTTNFSGSADTSIAVTTSPLATFSPNQITGLRFIGVSGAADWAGANDLYQGTYYTGNTVYFWPPAGGLFGRIQAGQVAQVELAPFGELHLYGVEARMIHGTPHPGREAVPWSDPDAAYLAVQGGQTLDAGAHRTTLYLPGQMLFERRISPLSCGPRPRTDDIGSGVAMRCWGHRTFDATTTTWYALGEAVVGPPAGAADVFKVGRSGTAKVRRAYEVVAQMICVSKRTEALPVEMRAQILAEDGTVYWTSDVVVLSLSVEACAPDRSFLRWTYLHPSGRYLGARSNLQGLLEDYGVNGALTTRLIAFDDDAAHPNARILSLQIRPSQSLPSQRFVITIPTSSSTRTRVTPYTVMLTGLVVQPAILTPIQDYGV